MTAAATRARCWRGWKDKTNRDIAQIRGLNPRTADKHLEQTYGKLGVENHTAAAVATHARRRDS
jgi:DNA-binding CsgD family transcriptional regulator